MDKYLKIIHTADIALPAGAFAIVFALLLSLGIANVLRGPSSADDAWIALTAKNIAVGKGYTTSSSSSKTVQFDPFISTGPSLVLPTALAIYIFGSLVWIPGAVQLFVFVIQLAAVTFLFAKRVSWAPALMFISVLTLLLILISLNNWFFGALLGEPVAFGFICLGVSLLASYTGLCGTISAGLCFSFAFLTKQISLFSVAGIFCAWLAIKIYERSDILSIIKHFLDLVLGCLSIPLAFEAVKLFTLGFEGYQHVIESTLNFAITQESSLLKLSVRWGSVLDIVFQSYMRPALAATIVLVSAVCLMSFINRDSVIVKRVAAFAWGGTIMHFAYITLLSQNIWPRHLWIGIAIAMVAVSASLLATSRKQRTIFLSLTLTLLLIFSFSRPIFALLEQIDTSTIASERAQVVNFLNDNPNVPYAAQDWSSIYDIVYLRRNEGNWRFGASIHDLQGASFIAVINNSFTEKNSYFFRSVNTNCKPLMHTYHFGLFHCN
jgi:hypothetical protein